MMRSALRFVCLTLLAGGLAGCFQPVHGTRVGNGQGSAFQAALADISVATVPGYLGYILKSELDYILTGGEPAKNTRYLLSIRLASASSSSIVDGISGRAQNVSLQVQALYELKETKTGAMRANGRIFSSAPFDRSTQRFSTIRAQREAEERVGKDIAQKLRLVLATALSREAPSPTEPPLEPQDFPEAIPEAPRSDQPGDDPN